MCFGNNVLLSYLKTPFCVSPPTLHSVVIQAELLFFKMEPQKDMTKQQHFYLESAWVELGIEIRKPKSKVLFLFVFPHWQHSKQRIVQGG